MTTLEELKEEVARAREEIGNLAKETDEKIQQLTDELNKTNLIVRGNVGIGTENPVGKLNIVHQPQNAGGNTLILGEDKTNNAHLRLGYHTEYSWIQSHGGKPLSINPIANNVGIGTTNPLAKLDIRGDLILEADDDPIIYTAAEGPEKNRYLHIVNAPWPWRSPSGLKAGGILVSENFPYAFPGKNDLIVEGNVGIGTAAPTAKLEVTGDLRLETGVAVNEFSRDDNLADNSNLAIPTEQAVKTYVDNNLDRKAALNGATNQDFTAQNLTVGGNLNVTGSLEVASPRIFLKGFDGANFNWIMVGGTQEGVHNVLGFHSETKSFVTASGWTKNFLINHPLDPKHKYLIHSTLEGPEVAVFYRGEAELNKGKAKIFLPDYFEALTKKEGRTVLVTPKFEVDEPISMLAASEVKEGKFFVKAIDDQNLSQPFYWEVKAIRADVEPLKVETMKID